MVGSPPPWRAAMMMARLSLLHSLPRLASMAPFLCLIVAQWEWPDMASPSAMEVISRFQLTELCANLPHLLFRAPPGARLKQLQGLLPGPARLLAPVQPEADVAQVVPDDRVVIAPRQPAGLLQLAAGLLQPAAAEQHPAQAIDVGGVVLVAVHAHRR